MEIERLPNVIKLKCLQRLWIEIVHGGILLDFHLGFQKCFPFSELLSILHWFGSRFLIWIGFIFPLVRGIISLPVVAFLLSPIKTLVICTSVLANSISWETDLDFLTSGNDLSCCHRSAFLAYKPTSFYPPNDPSAHLITLDSLFQIVETFSSFRILIVLMHL